jgi:uncharacterized protein (DUF433 family)
MVSTTVMSINYIVKTPGICGGAARIDGVRLPVHSLISQIQNGATVDEILQGYEHFSLTRAQVYAALAYYYDHQAEIDQLLREDDQFFELSKQEADAFRSNLANGETFITAREASERLGLSSQSSQVAHLCQEGKLECKKVANRWFISLSSVESYAASDRKTGPK